jgi:ribosomal protein S18 acetylase RimI-like enzyme
MAPETQPGQGDAAWQSRSMVTTRHAVPADENAVLDLWQRAGGPTHQAPSMTLLRQLVERDPQALLIAEVDGCLAGTLVVGWDGWRCHLYRMAVEPDLRRRGIASHLLDAAVVRAAGLGARRLEAMVKDGNVDAEEFWQSAGFGRDADDSRWSRRL